MKNELTLTVKYVDDLQYAVGFFLEGFMIFSSHIDSLDARGSDFYQSLLVALRENGEAELVLDFSDKFYCNVLSHL